MSRCRPLQPWSEYRISVRSIFSCIFQLPKVNIVSGVKPFYWINFDKVPWRYNASMSPLEPKPAILSCWVLRSLQIDIFVVSNSVFNIYPKQIKTPKLQTITNKVPYIKYAHGKIYIHPTTCMFLSLYIATAGQTALCRSTIYSWYSRH